MKTNNLLGILALLLCTFSFISCNDEDEKTEIYHLSFEKSYYECPLIGAKDIMIRGGNRDYSIKIENPSILEIKVDLSSAMGMGSLELYPKQKGETTIQVKDNITNETVNLRIRVIDSYLNLAIANPIKPPYVQGDEFFLINNEHKDFYLYDTNWNLKNTGVYKFSIENNTPYMELTYQKEFEGKTSYKYDLSKTSQSMFAVIKLYLNWDWHDSIRAITTKEVAPIIMNATDIDSNTEYFFIRKTNDIPENILGKTEL